jgi:TolB-like protein
MNSPRVRRLSKVGRFSPAHVPPAMSASVGKAVFLSYASQDAAAAKRICETLRAAGVEVWLDQSELVGGDAWDQKIRGQVATCALFVPIVSAATQARREGYFRLEWKLADERTHLMAEGTPFLLPVVIDETKDREALVPKSFLSVQWTRLPGGEKAEAFGVRVMSLLGGGAVDVGPVVDRERGQRPGLQPKVGRRVPAPAWIAVGAALALGLVGYFWLRAPQESAPISAQNAGAGTRPPTSEKAAPAEAKSVAVLAFKNLSGDPAREFFSEGLSEAVTDVLGRVPGLKVVGSASAFSFKGKSVSIPEIARQLGVTHLVEGTVLQEGQTVRITAKLITADGFQVWVSDKLEREAKNIFALHDEVAGLIAKNLSLQLGASSAASKAPVNPQAYELYVQARQAWNLRTSEGFDLAESALTRALALEPNFARAHAAIADVWSQRLLRAQTANETEDPLNLAEPARIQAKITETLTLDPDSAEAHASLGQLFLVEGKNSEAESPLRRAVALNPNYASAHQWLGVCLTRLAHMDEALKHLKLASALDPLSPIIWANYGRGLCHVGRYAEGINAFDRALTFRSNDTMNLSLKTHALVELERFTEAVTLARSLPRDFARITSYQMFVFARAGLTAEAEALLAEVRPTESVRLRIGTLLALGRKEEAMALITMKKIRSGRAVDYFWDPIFDPVRNDPRWVKFIADAGETEAHARAQAWRAAHPLEKPAVK